MTNPVDRITQLAHLQSARGHQIHVSRCGTTGNIHIFKYDRTHCDYDVFQDQTQAADWMIQPVQLSQWRVVVD